MDKNSAPDAPALRLVGRYQLVSPVVSGALGELWRAKIASGPEDGRVVLVRLIPRGAAIDGRAVERLTNAGFAAMELRHAKIAAVLDVVVADAEIAIVSEHIAGAPLQSVSRQTGPKRTLATPALALRIVADVLEAVDAVRAPWAELTAHPETDDERALASGIHGGLIPDDLLIATFGETMLLESGLAGVAMTLPSISDHPDVVAYRAPEQIEPKEPIDERADVFTVGVIAWELMTGRSLFGPMLLPRPPTPGAPGGPARLKPLAEAAQTSSVKRKVLSAPIQRLDSLPVLKGKVTKELANWVARCLERDRGARFQTLREALTELHALGPGAVATADQVSKWVTASGVLLDLLPDSAQREPAPASNRPTAPPAEEGAARDAAASADEPVTSPATGSRGGLPLAVHLKATTPMGVVAPFAAAEAAVARSGRGDAFNLTVESLMPSDSVPPSSMDVESVPPSSMDVESVPPSSMDVESVPPSSMDVESVPPPSGDAPTLPPAAAERGSDVESIPPSSSDAPTLPPLSAGSSGDVESVPPSSAGEGALSSNAFSEATLVESAPPFGTEPTMMSSVLREAVPPEPAALVTREPAARLAAPFEAPPGAFPGVGPAVTEEPTSAPVVRAVAAPATDEISDDYPAARHGSARREANKRIVGYVMGGAAALVVAGVLRLLLGGKSDAAGPTVSPAALAPSPSARTALTPSRSGVVAPAPDEISRAAAAAPAGVPVAATDTVPRGEASAEPTDPPPSGGGKVLPTSAPSPTRSSPRGDTATPKPAGNKRKAYRPTGI